MNHGGDRIGGSFFRARDPEGWRRGPHATRYYPPKRKLFFWEQQAGPTVFTPFAADTDYFAADKEFMINLRWTTSTHSLVIGAWGH